MSYGVQTVHVHKKLKLDKRQGSENWYARLTLDNGKRVVRSTNTDNLEDAKVYAWALLMETQARIANNLPAQTRKFKHVAEFAIKRMQDDLDAGAGKQAYKDYISALTRWLIPYFGDTDVEKIDLAGLTKFDAWRTKTNKKPFSQSGINNHNAALNRVFDEAEMHGWIVNFLRPKLPNKGTKSESRGSFTDAEYKKIYTALRTFDKKTANTKAAATRETLRNYVLFLANTGVRHGTEALGLRWRSIEWQELKGERYLIINVDGKTRKRTVVARDRVEEYLTRQCKLNPNIVFTDFDSLIDAKLDDFVFTTSLGEVATLHNLAEHFKALLNELGLRVGADGKTRTLYSWRHYYATQDLKRGMSTHTLSRQMGNSTTMLDKHYSKYSPLFNAHMHSGRASKTKTAPATAATSSDTIAETAFAMLDAGTLTSTELLAALGTRNADYKVTETTALKALYTESLRTRIC